jgi:hypothetical protein
VALLVSDMFSSHTDEETEAESSSLSYDKTLVPGETLVERGPEGTGGHPRWHREPVGISALEHRVPASWPRAFHTDSFSHHGDEEAEREVVLRGTLSRGSAGG